jgi:site-specific DNA-methyltransferase (adenine-specific)
MIKKLYYGDNLEILREQIDDEIIDLIYLDPPFNSQANYNVIFNNPKGEKSQAQITAFEDTWTWNIESERALQELKQIRGDLAELLDLLVRTLGKNSLSAYLAMMAIRLVELHRVLKPTGSLYLHCDPTASHYLKMILDLIFGAINFRNQITWKRQSAHSDAKHRFANVADIILFYAKSKEAKFKPQYGEYDPEYVSKNYRHNDQDGRGLYCLGDMTSPNPRPNMMYDWMGFSYPKKGWRYQRETMQKLHDEGRIYYPKKDDGSYDYSKRPALKRYLNEQKGSILTNIWMDIPPLSAQAKERLGYPTQKPQQLLERIILASSNENDLILDPFCGCGTTIHAAEKLNRQWIGIDITHLAISLIEKRLRDAFSDKYLDNIQDLKRKKTDFFEVEGTPKTLDSAQDLFNRDPYQFQWWAISLVNAQPYQGKKRKGADSGIDGIIYFDDFDSGKSEAVIKKIIVSVKGGKNINAAMIRDLRGTMEANKAVMGFFITLTPPTKPMEQEAVKSGFYLAGNGKEYPVIQIFSIEGLINGNEYPKYYDLSLGKSTFKQAQKEEYTNGEQMTINGI